LAVLSRIRLEIVMSYLTRLAVAAVASLVLFPATIRSQDSPVPSADTCRQLHWRFIGPEGNRFSAAAGVPGDPSTY
jgi:hypothetical protein